MNLYNSWIKKLPRVAVRAFLSASYGWHQCVVILFFLDLGSFLHVFNLAELSFPELKDGIQERT